MQDQKWTRPEKKRKFSQRRLKSWSWLCWSVFVQSSLTVHQWQCISKSNATGLCKQKCKFLRFSCCSFICLWQIKCMYLSNSEALMLLAMADGWPSPNLNTLSMTDSSVLVVSRPQKEAQSFTTMPAPITSLPLLIVPACGDRKDTLAQKHTTKQNNRGGWRGKGGWRGRGGRV